MLSKALSHFPQFRFRDGEKRLWNPILKKTFVNLPEERVRLKLIDFLTMESGISDSRISFESPVKLVGDKSKSRTDIICYDNDFKPLLLVECKAPDIKLDEKAAIQVARYNQKVGAPFVLVSNGTLDFWFKIEDEQVISQEKIPKPFKPMNEIQRPLTYWEERAFVGQKLKPEAKVFATNTCTALFGDPHQPVKFLSFEGFPSEFALGHYYRIFGVRENVKMGISIAANSFGRTRLNVVLNEAGANTAFFTTSLDLIAEQEKKNTEIHSSKGRSEIDLTDETGFDLNKNIVNVIPEFHRLLLKHS
ncbi:MAG TPA: type I restriction enzyme HsdR N-terminal domain-containing protein [Gracilimonas sp.]|uniref:type I restriction enzyme HsdR N-terminal domain-containing protein n=1 Tax=Gracilimonas sp. TaxID=1974203 RepID=UPI002D94D41A|nr:type I restriction enzyme HsdR N-terminal domain-containing protein [Gracilimonas sp.]